MTRKHMYLVTEHERDDHVGGVKIFESPLSKPLKNEEGPITVLDEDRKDFKDIGKQVHLGYADFEDEDEFEETAADVLKAKIRSVDRKWAEKAGVVEEVYVDE